MIFYRFVRHRVFLFSCVCVCVCVFKISFIFYLWKYYILYELIWIILLIVSYWIMRRNNLIWRYIILIQILQCVEWWFIIFLFFFSKWLLFRFMLWHIKIILNNVLYILILATISFEMIHCVLVYDAYLYLSVITFIDECNKNVPF